MGGLGQARPGAGDGRRADLARRRRRAPTIPRRACLAAQYAGWKLEHDDFFAMASGPGRALARAEDLFDQLAWREQADRAVLCLETRQDPPAAIVEKVAQRCGVEPSAVTFLIAPTASVCGSVQISARVVETALHKLHELGVDPARVRHGWGCCPIAPVARNDPTAIGRTNDAVLYGGTVHLWIEGPDDEVADLAQAAALVRLGCVRHPVRGAARGGRLELLRHRSDAVQPRRGHADQHRVRAGASRRRARARGARALVHVVTGPLRVAVLGASGSWHSRGLIDALAARGHEVLAIPATRLRSVVDSSGARARARSRRCSRSTRSTC